MRNAILALSMSFLAACGSPSTEAPDVAGQGAQDAAASAGLDASSVPAQDAGALPSDAADLPVDAALPGDAATSGPDAAQAGADAASPGPDAGPSFPACAAAFAGCTDYTDATAEGASRTITFPGSYSPKCLKVSVGQTVTFSGSFSSHPLEQSCGPRADITAVSSGKTATYTLTAPGDYGYFCTFHGDSTGSGMAGSIRVVP